MILEILTPERTLYSGEVALVQLPGSDGSFEIQMMHAPMISTLKDGFIRFIRIEDKKSQQFKIQDGVVEVKNDKVTVLVNE